MVELLPITVSFHNTWICNVAPNDAGNIADILYLYSL